MKLLSTIMASICLIITTQAFSQTDTVTVEGDTLVYKYKMDSLMQNLNKIRLAYPILYNRVYPFACLKDTLTSEDTINTSYFIQAYSELQRANYNYTPVDSIFDYRLTHTLLYSENRKDTIPMVALNMLFCSIDSAAYSDGRIDTVAGLMYDGPNPANPYFTHNACFAIPGVVMDLDSGKTYKLHFPRYYEFGNSSDSVINITVYNPLTSQTVSLDRGEAKNITFHHPGSNVLTITATLSSTRTVSYKFHLKVTSNYPDDQCIAGPYSVTADIGFQGYDESSAAVGKGEFKVFFNTVTCDWNKPIIIPDGFDPLDKHSFDQIFYGFLEYNNRTQNFGEEMRDLGYDIVILNFPTYYLRTVTKYIPILGSYIGIPVNEYRFGGADHIERNSFVFVKLIQQINGILASKGNSNKLVVVGTSMAGQISRYGLKYMENNSLTHNTRLWVSFDSPHLGANLPWGLQEMVRYLYINKGSEEAGFTYNMRLRSIAARQLLIHQTSPWGPMHFPWSTYAMNNQEPFRTTWKNTLSSIGFPSNLRKVALVNGTYTGANIHTPGSKIFDMNVMNVVTLMTAKPYFIKTTLSTLFESSEFGKGTVYKVGTHTSLPFGALDGSPGGMFDFQQDFFDSVNNKSTLLPLGSNISIGAKTYVGNLTHNINFIPTPSGLALNSSNFNWNNSLDVNDLLCNNGTPFDNIFVPNVNQAHSSLTPESVLWLKEEIEDGSLPCDKICATISGPFGIAISEDDEVILTGVPSGVSVYWSTTSGLQINSFSSSTCEVERTSSGTDWVYAHIDNPCGADVYLKKKIFTSSPKQGITSVRNVKQIGINIYPNPSEDFWNITIDKSIPAHEITGELFDIKGQKVWRCSSLTKDNIIIDNRSFSKGIYTLKLSLNNKTFIRKLIK